jgi:2-keto-3-deoxy-L-fuconate dehydrogenase
MPGRHHCDARLCAIIITRGNTMGRLDKKIALISGAGAGIGEASCMRLASEGATIVAMDLKADAAQRVADAVKKAGGKAHAQGGDVSKLADCKRVVDWTAANVGTPNILGNIAGIVETGTLLEASEESFDRSMDINVKGMWYMSKLVVPLMLKAGGGSVINMCSVAGTTGVKDRGVYSISKAAVAGLTKSLAMDFITQGVRCNAICPGTVETPSLHDRVRAISAQMGGEEAAMKMFVSRQPMGRLGRADEIAALVAYLASDESQYMTGQLVFIDGGMKV